MLENMVVNPNSTPSLESIPLPAVCLSAHSVLLRLPFVSQGYRVHPQPEGVPLLWLEAVRIKWSQESFWF